MQILISSKDRLAWTSVTFYSLVKYFSSSTTDHQIIQTIHLNYDTTEIINRNFLCKTRCSIIHSDTKIDSQINNHHDIMAKYESLCSTQNQKHSCKINPCRCKMVTELGRGVPQSWLTNELCYTIDFADDESGQRRHFNQIHDLWSPNCCIVISSSSSRRPCT